MMAKPIMAKATAVWLVDNTTLSFKQIADMCGTSVAQIERTYYHLNDEIRLTNALADYRRNEDGTIEAI